MLVVGRDRPDRNISSSIRYLRSNPIPIKPIFPIKSDPHQTDLSDPHTIRRKPTQPDVLNPPFVAVGEIDPTDLLVQRDLAEVFVSIAFIR